MLASEFVQAYPRDLTPERVHNGATLRSLRISQLNSYAYGQLLHDALSGQLDRDNLPTVPHPGSFSEVEQALTASGQWEEYRQEIDFHELNQHMIDMWTPVLLGGWPEGIDHARMAHLDMNMLALAGLGHFAQRDAFAREHGGTEILYTPENEGRVSILNGSLQQIDVGIVALGFLCRHPGLAMVPAPMQFEREAGSRGKGGKNANADFVVVDVVNQRAVGVQSKTTVRHSTVEEYDEDRIVLIDGSVDLGNLRVVRVQRGSSKKAVRPWAGIVAASRVDAIKLHGKGRLLDELGNRALRSDIIHAKLRARALVGNLRVDWRDLSAKIEDRILAKLYA